MSNDALLPDSGSAYPEDVKHIDAELRELRHELHQHPEVGLDLPVTQRRVLQALAGLPLEITLGQSTTSITAVLRGGRAGEGAATVLLRGDMDALPLQEESGVPYASTIRGVMHACGHDTHTTMLVGAARLLSAHRAELAGDVIFMFQPGEEGFDGARHMLAEGVLEAAGRPIAAAYGVHVFSSRFPRGTFIVREGVLLSACDTVVVTVIGRGGHGSAPQRTADPITAAAEMILTLQTVVTRRFDVFDPVVLSVGMIRGGETENVIPDAVELRATVRTYSAASRERMRQLFHVAVEGVASAHGVSVDVDYREMYPVTENDVAESRFARGVVAEVFGAARLTELQDPLTASEDFARVLQQVPGAFVLLGATTTDSNEDAAPDNHSSRASFSDDVLSDGAVLLATLAHRRLEVEKA